MRAAAGMCGRRRAWTHRVAEERTADEEGRRCGARVVANLGFIGVAKVLGGREWVDGMGGREC